MPRLIEIALFLAPFIAFAAWRLMVPSLVPPMWFVAGLGSVVAILLVGLLWLHQHEAGDAQEGYVPATLEDGRVIPGHAAQRP